MQVTGMCLAPLRSPEDVVQYRYAFTGNRSVVKRADRLEIEPDLTFRA